MPALAIASRSSSSTNGCCDSKQTFNPDCRTARPTLKTIVQLTSPGQGDSQQSKEAESHLLRYALAKHPWSLSPITTLPSFGCANRSRDAAEGQVELPVPYQAFSPVYSAEACL